MKLNKFAYVKSGLRGLFGDALFSQKMLDRMSAYNARLVEYENLHKGSTSDSSLLDSLHPIWVMKKDLVDTCKPYKGWYQVRSDLAAPFVGIANIVRGVDTLVAAPLRYLRDLLSLAASLIREITTDRRRRFSLKVLSLLVVFPFIIVLNVFILAFDKFPSLIYGAARIFQGLTQITVATAFAIPKLLLRACVTAYTGVSRVEQNKKIVELYDAALKVIDVNEQGESSRSHCSSSSGYYRIENETSSILKVLHEKFQHTVQKGQPTNIDTATENTLYADCYQPQWMEDVKPLDLDKAKTYLSFFSSGKLANQGEIVKVPLAELKIPLLSPKS